MSMLFQHHQNIIIQHFCKTSIFMVLIFIVSACGKEEFEPPRTALEATKLAEEWKRPFYEDSTFGITQTSYFSGNYVAYCPSYPELLSNSPGIGVYHQLTGEKHPAWQGSIGTNMDEIQINSWGVSQSYDNLALVQEYSESVNCYDIATGTNLWTVNYQNFAPLIVNDFGESLYRNIGNSSTTNINAINVQTGQESTIFQLNSESQDNYLTNFGAFQEWLAPWGDRVLVFQNRKLKSGTYDHVKVDLYAYNLSADTLLWKMDELIYQDDPENSIETPEVYAQPKIIGNRLYIVRALQQHCIDLEQAEKVWSRDIALTQSNFTDFHSPIMQVDDVLYIQGRDFISALDSNSGSTLWKSDLSPAGRFDYYQDKIYQSAVVDGDRYIFCLDAKDGSLMWYANQFSDGTFLTSSIFDININKQNGLMYSSDLKYAFCIDLNKMPQ